MESGKLYIVATPIGNMEDMTFRAVRLLGEVDLILCEDTRTTRHLLKHYDIKTPCESYNSHATTAKSDRCIKLLEEGKTLALVSDAGTPCISDPGVHLVRQVRDLLPEVQVLAVPGPSALVAALSVSGVPASEFTFLGFLPHKKGRETLFKMIAGSELPVAFYESPHRIEKALASLVSILPAEAKVVVCRELTKIFEECVSGSAQEVLDYFTNNSEKVRGEFVVIVSPK